MIRPLSALLVLLCWCPAPLRAGDSADDAYAYIAGLAEKGLDELVVKSAREFLAQNPKHARAVHASYRLGCALLSLGDARGASAALEPATTAPGFEFQAEAHLRLGRSRLLLGDAARARECAERAQALGRDYLAPLALALAADADTQLGDWAKARKDYAAWLALETEPARKLDAEIGLAWAELRGRDPRGAEKRVFALVDSGRATSAREDELLVLVGECALDDERAADALKRFREVRDPAWSDAATRGAGFALAALGKHAEAADEFQRVARLEKKSRFAAECALHEGIERLAAGDAAGARAALSSAILPNSVEASFWRARAELESNDAARALKTLEAALALAPDAAWKARLETARGAALDRLGRTAEAALAFAQSGSADGLQAAAAGRLNQGQFDAAAELARRAVPLAASPERAALAWLVVGEAERGAKRWAPAEAAFLEAARLEPDAVRSARARLRAAWCRFESGDAAAARANFEEASRASLPPVEAEEAHFMVGRCHEAAGESERAARAYDEHLGRFADGAHAVEAAVRSMRLAPDAERAARLESAVARPTDESAGKEKLAAAEALASAAQRTWIELGHFEIAERAASASQFDAALRHYTAVSESTADAALSARARYGAAWCAFSLERFEDAARTLAPLTSRDSEPSVRSAALELLVFAHVKRSDVDAALEAWRHLAQEGGSLEKALGVAREVVELARDKGRLADVATSLAALARTAQGGARHALSALRARVQSDLGQSSEAEATLTSIPEEGRRDPLARVAVADAAFALAEARADKGEYDAATKLYALAAGSPEFADRALYKSGFVALKRGDAAAAEGAFERLVASCPQSPLIVEALFLRGEALHRLERFDQAIPLFERVRRESPRHAVAPKALFRLGQCLTRTQRFDEALAAFESLERAAPDFANQAEIELDRGRARIGLQDPRAARAAFDRVIARGASPAADRARLEIGKLLAGGDDHEGALEQFLKVALLATDAACVPEALFAAGNELEALGQPERAADRYRELTTNHAASPFAARARERLEGLETKKPTPPKKRRA